MSQWCFNQGVSIRHCKQMRANIQEEVKMVTGKTVFTGRRKKGRGAEIFKIRSKDRRKSEKFRAVRPWSSKMAGVSEIKLF